MYKERTKECHSSEQALKIYFTACLPTESYHSTTVIKMVELLSKDYTHYFIAENVSLNKTHNRRVLHFLTLGSQTLF